MEYKLLNKIFDDINETFFKESNFNEDFFAEFFTVGSYIRNNYLWDNDRNIDYFFKFYGVCHPDDISLCIILDFKSHYLAKKTGKDCT